MKTILAVFLAFALLPAAGYAADFGPWGADVGASLGLGNMQNHSSSIPSRTMDSLGLHAMPGYKLMPGLLLGVRFEYDFVGQRTEPADVLNQNLKGHGYLLGIGGEYTWGQWLVSAGFDFLGTYSQSLGTASAQDSSFSKPLGFRIGGGYLVTPEISVDAGARITWYGRNNLAGSPIDISQDHLRQMDFALGASYHF